VPRLEKVVRKASTFFVSGTRFSAAAAVAIRGPIEGHLNTELVRIVDSISRDKNIRERLVYADLEQAHDLGRGARLMGSSTRSS